MRHGGLLTQNLTSCSLFPLVLSCPSLRTSPHTVSEEKEEVTMDTSENRPENEVPEPPVPIADQVSNDDRPEGSAEDEEKKEVNFQATCWGGRAGTGLGERVDHFDDPSYTVG